jgi:hypothetical protein
MIVNYSDHPVPHLIIDNFIENYDEISSLAEDLYYLTDLGTHNLYIKDLVKRNEFYLHSRIKDPSVKKLVDCMDSIFWTDKTRQIYDNAPFPFPMLNSVTYSGLLLGYYGDSGYYSMHKDTCFITGLVFMHKEMNFEGGNFILSNRTELCLDKEIQSIEIQSLPNRAIFFPSCYFHGVSKTKTKDNEVSSMRISFQNFMSFKND